MFRALLITLSLVTSTVGHAQSLETGRPAIARDSVPQSIADAEAQGARASRGPHNNPDPYGEGLAIGTNERRCVAVDTLRVARSGDFIAGPFALYDQLWRMGYGKIWWQPDHVDTPTVATLIVRAVRLDSTHDARVFEQPFITQGVDRQTHVVSRVQFYPSPFHVPSAGRWLFVATAGANWGCFVLNVA